LDPSSLNSAEGQTNQV